MSKKLQNKISQLGMNPGTASARLVKDLLWKFIVDAGQDTCIRCDGKMRRDNFSVEHVKPWMNSEDPVGLFFNLENISFSHQSCNTRKLNESYMGERHGLLAHRNGCRCDVCVAAAKRSNDLIESVLAHTLRHGEFEAS